MEEIRVLGLSTGHVTEATARQLDMGAPEFATVECYPTLSGWFVFAGTPAVDEAPADLRAVLDLARRNAFRWILFDRDARHVDELEVFS